MQVDVSFSSAHSYFELRAALAPTQMATAWVFRYPQLGLLHLNQVGLPNGFVEQTDVAQDFLPIEPNDQPTEELVEIVLDLVFPNLTHFKAEFHSCLSTEPHARRRPQCFQLMFV